jgi:hypothetical protein
MSEKTSSQIEWLTIGMTCHLLLSAADRWFSQGEPLFPLLVKLTTFIISLSHFDITLNLLNISPERMSEKTSSQMEWLTIGMTCHLLVFFYSCPAIFEVVFL